MEILDKLHENLSWISFRKKKKITVFISIEDKIMAKKEIINPSLFINQKRSLYIKAVKIYKPRFLIMYLFGSLFLKKKKGYKRMEKGIPRFQIINWYKGYLKGIPPRYDNHPIVFEIISGKPSGNNEDEYGFEESKNW